MITLRPYQKKTKTKVLKAVKAKKNTMYILPTGGGKTPIFSRIVAELKKQNLSIIVAVHRESLLGQAVEDLWDVGIRPAIIHGRKKIQKQVSVAMVKTLQNTNIKSDIIIIDECHRGEFDYFFTDPFYKKIIKIGCTATPIKNFSKNDLCFPDMYQEYIEEASIRDLLRKKFLCNVINKSYNISKEGASGVDFSQPETIENVMYELESFEREHGRGKTLFFTANQSIARSYLAAFEKEGINSLLVTSDTPEKERKEAMKLYHDLSSGYDYMFSCDILLTGYNFKELTRVVWLRSTDSLIVWLQGNGRGSRTTDKIYKRFFYCLDFGQNLQRLGSWDAEHDMYKYYCRTPEDNEDETVSLYICQNEGCFATYTEKIARCLECGEPFEVEGELKRIAREGEALEFEPQQVVKRFYIFRKENDLYESIKGIYLEFGRTSLYEIFPLLPDNAKEGKSWATDSDLFIESFEDYYL